jgi:hypothetical protein
MTKDWDPNEFTVGSTSGSDVGENMWDPDEFSGKPKKKKEEKKSNVRSIGQQASDLVEDVKAAGTAAVDLIGALPGMVGGAIGTGVGMATHGSKAPAQELLQGIGEGAERAMPSTHIDALRGQRERTGYQAAMKPVEAITELFHAGGKGVEKGSAALGASPEQAKELGAGTEVGLMAAAPFLRRPAAAPGSNRAYQQIHEQQRGGMSDAAIDAARETYPKPEEVKPWDANEFKKPLTEEFAPEFRPDQLSGADEAIMTAPERGMRDTIARPDLEVRGMREEHFAPEMTEFGYTETQGPRARTPSNEVEFRQYQADRLVEQMEAAEKPGFQRDAIETMRANELQRAEQKPATTVTNQQIPPAKAPEIHYQETFNPTLKETLDRWDIDAARGKNTVREGLDIIAKTSDRPYYKELAKKLLDDEEFTPGVKVGQSHDLANFDLTRDRITMRGEAAGLEQVFLHEVTHARTLAPIYSRFLFHQGATAKWDTLPAKVKASVERLEELFYSFHDDVAAKNPQIAAQYGMTDLAEFVSEAFTSPTFQTYLANAKLPQRFRKGGLSNYWDSFVNAVGKMFGLERGHYLSEVLREGANLMSATGKAERLSFADMVDIPPVARFGGRLKKNQPVVATQEAAREFRLDSPEKLEQEIIPALTKEGAKLQDFTAKDSNGLYQVMLRFGSLVKENLLQDTTLGQIMKEKPGTGPLVKWTVDQVSRIERQGIIKTKDAIDIALKPFRKMYHSPAARAELRQAVDTWFENTGVKDLTRADFRTEKQWNIYKNFQGIHDKILNELNEKRAAAGFKPIERIPSYFHAAWEGDYRVFAYKGDGTKVWAQGFKTEWQAKKFQKEYAKRHPELRVDPVEHISRSKYELSDLSAFEDAIRTMSKDDPATKALQSTYRDLLQHRGFGRTGVHRKGVLGFMGMEEGKIGLKMMEKSFDQYVNQAYRYMGNLEKQKVLSDLQKVPLEVRKQLPETFDFLYSYLRKTQGAKLDKVAYDTFFEQITKLVGLGAGFPLRFVRSGSQLASIYWLTTPRFLISQTVQSMNAIPKLFQQHGVVDGTRIFFDGWNHAAQHMLGFSRDGITEAGIKWASERGYLDPTIKNMITGDPFEVPIGSKLQAFKEVASYPAALVEHHLVRLPTFIMFEKGLREYIRDPEARFQEAAEKTDYYMVNYARAHSPLIYDKLGLVGEAARPLKQYAHNTWGQFIEYSKGLKDRGEVAPLAGFLGVQATVAGLKGVILVAEATAIVTMLNVMFGLDIPTPEQLLLKSNLHDALTYGGLSYTLGHDVSASVSAPSLPQMFSFPAISFGAKMITDVGGFLLKLSKGEDTDQDRLRAAMAISPNLMHEWLKNLYTPDGQPVVNPNDPQLRGNYRRSTEEEWTAAVLGAKPLSEAKIDAIMRAGKQEIRRDIERRMDALDAIVDSVMNGQEVNPKLLEKYIREGGDPSRLSANITRRLKERTLTGPEREQDFKRASPSQIHRLEVLKDYLDEQTPKKGMFDPESGVVLPPRSDWTGGIQTVQDRKLSPLYDEKKVLSDTTPPVGAYRGAFPTGDPNMDKKIVRGHRTRIDGEFIVPKAGRIDTRRIRM